MSESPRPAASSPSSGSGGSAFRFPRVVFGPGGDASSNFALGEAFLGFSPGSPSSAPALLFPRAFFGPGVKAFGASLAGEVFLSAAPFFSFPAAGPLPAARSASTLALSSCRIRSRSIDSLRRARSFFSSLRALRSGSSLDFFLLSLSPLDSELWFLLSWLSDRFPPSAAASAASELISSLSSLTAGTAGAVSAFATSATEVSAFVVGGAFASGGGLAAGAAGDGSALGVFCGSTTWTANLEEAVCAAAAELGEVAFSASFTGRLISAGLTGSGTLSLS
mmetsp:Transcript_3551/g.8269  ORF Transcript_3551/g.8269 Transcript_3551/m.8269 type:complete len:279 (+) Transcript_3551:329-1165(+)